VDTTNNRKSHEGKPDQAAGFKGSHVPSSRADPKWRVGNADRDPEPRVDTLEAVEITGQWRHTGEKYHLFINQAGAHIEMLLALVESGNQGHGSDKPRDKLRSETRLFRFGGDVNPNEREHYDLYAHHPDLPVEAKDHQCGSMHYTHNGKRLILNIDLSRLPDTKFADKFEHLSGSMAVRFGRAANLLDNHLNKTWVPPEVRSAHWFPLTPTQEQEIPGFLFDARISLDSENYRQHQKSNQRKFGYVELVERYFEFMGKVGPLTPLTQDAKQQMSNIASALDGLVFKAWNTSLQAPAWKGGVDIFQADYWRDVTLDALARRHLEIDPTFPRSLLTHTQAIIDRFHQGVSMDNFHTHLHLEKHYGGHNYTATIELLDVDGTKDDVDKLTKLLEKVAKANAGKVAEKITKYMKFGMLAGVLTVDKPEPGAFHAQYVIALGGLKISKSIGTSGALIASSGEALNVYGPAWRPENIRGTASLVEAGGGWFGGGDGKGGSLSVLRCRGSGNGKPPTPLNINFSGFSDIISPGAGGGLSFMRYAGMILDGVLDGGDVTVPDDQTVFEYGVHPSIGALHFPINGAGLERDACALLEVFAASELAVLSRRGVEIAVHGYADQPDKDLHNMILSRSRAISVFNFLKNILGKRLDVPDLKEIPSEAKERGDAEDASAQKTTYIYSRRPKQGSLSNSCSRGTKVRRRDQ
jgi:hypothetical protein